MYISRYYKLWSCKDIIVPLTYNNIKGSDIVKYTVFNIPSMHNHVSAGLIESSLNSISGVKNVNANYEQGIVEVFYESSKNNFNTIIKKVENLGYEIE